MSQTTNQRHELIRQKFTQLYTQAKKVPYMDVNLSSIYREIGREMCYTPNYIRKVVKNYI